MLRRTRRGRWGPLTRPGTGEVGGPVENRPGRRGRVGEGLRKMLPGLEEGVSEEYGPGSGDGGT